MWHIVIWNHKSTCIYFQQIYHALCCYTRINMYSHITNGTSERGIQGQFVKRGYFQQWEHCTIFVHVNDSRSFQMVMTLLSSFQYNVFKLYCIFVFHKLSTFPNLPTNISLSEIALALFPSISHILRDQEFEIQQLFSHSTVV
jgi:hypothetical protein